MKEIIAAVAKAMGEMQRISKDSRNTEQKYDFASVDDFLAMTGPICSQNGIVTLINETAAESFERQGKYGATHWLRLSFEIHTMHSSGESLPVVNRTVEVIRTGAQSFGSAQSYVLKQYLRALYQIATGDNEDVDFGEKGDGPVTKQEPRDTGPTAMQQAIAALSVAETLDALVSVWGGIPRSVQADAGVIQAKDARKAELTTKNADLGNDTLPY